MLERDRALPDARGSRVGAGRAGEHGRVGLRASAARGPRPARAVSPCSRARAAPVPRKDPRRVTRRTRNGSSRRRLRRAKFDSCEVRRQVEGSKSKVHMSINIVVPEVGESIVDARVAQVAEEGRRRRSPPASRSSSSRPTRSTSKWRRRRPACCRRIAHGDGADVKIGDVLRR